MLRFAVFTALGMAVAAVLLIMVVRHYDTVQAEHAAIDRARFTTDAFLRDALRPADLRSPVVGARRRTLDRLFARALVDGSLRASVISRKGFVTYSTDHRAIGTRAARTALLRDALGGRVVSHVFTDDARRANPKLLETLVPVVLGRAKTAGAISLEQDYKPIAAAADETVFPVAAVLELVLLALFLVLVPVLARVSQRLRRHVTEVEYRARHDDLTGLPNRLSFHAALAGSQARRPAGASDVVLLVDLDGFKEINDTLGHRAGDELLLQAARRLRGLVSRHDLLARLGGDEFGLLLRRADAAGAIACANRLRASLAQPFELDGVPVAIEASVGIAVTPDHGTDAEILLQRADVAMYLAKERRSGSEIYRDDADSSDADRLALMSQLRRALENGEITLYFQPQFDLASGEVTAYEALVRWIHPDRGVIGAGEFVPWAERTGLVRDLSRFVVDRGVAECTEWERLGVEVEVAVNLTAFDLLDPTLPDFVAETLARHGLAAERLVLEVTEGTIVVDEARAAGVLRALAALGVRVAIDDFGVGYSSVSHLQRLPFSEVKIDRSFVDGVTSDQKSLAIVQWTVDLASAIGMSVVAEGVETEEQLQVVTAAGCHRAQGFLLGEPLPAAAVRAQIGRFVEDGPDATASLAA